MTLLWLLIWYLAWHHTLTLDPVNAWAATLILAIGLDLSHAGEIFAFLGPNGAGKTTTVEILEGVPLARRRRGFCDRRLGPRRQGDRDLALSLDTRGSVAITQAT